MIIKQVYIKNFIKCLTNKYMTDIHDIKWKIDILNYTYLLFFVFVALFIALFYFVLSKFLDYKEEKKKS